MRTITIASWVLAAVGAGCAWRHDPAPPSVEPEQRAVAFLAREVPAWSKENGCFSCHNNGDAARALYQAAAGGYRLASDVLADTTGWVARPEAWEQNQGDPGYSDHRLANIQFAASLTDAVLTGHLARPDALRAAARRLVADQDANGSWPVEQGHSLGSPATHGTPLATFLAWRTLRQTRATPETRAALDKAERWLERASARHVLDAASLLLAAAHDPRPSARARADRCVYLIRSARTSEGGWGPYADSAAEPFDTAVVLLALCDAATRWRDASTGELVRSGRQFLVSTQNPDGSWPATTRPPRGDSYAQKMSTTGWATLALLRSRDAAGHQHARWD